MSTTRPGANIRNQLGRLTRYVGRLTRYVGRITPYVARGVRRITPYVGRLTVRRGKPPAGARMRTVAALAAGLTILGPLVLTDGDDVSAAPVGSATATRPRPDVVLILTDDQRTDSLLGMSSVRRLLVDRGTRFTQAHVPNSLCCPSRATILTGRYSHDTGVWRNFGRNGGWRAFHRRGYERRTVAVALQAAGYRTAILGKYLNAFDQNAPRSYRPPGWNWFEPFRGALQAGTYYNFRLGSASHVFGQGSQNYSTDVLASQAVDFIWSTPQDRSLFLYVAPFAPHAPALAAPRDIGALDGELPSYRPRSNAVAPDDPPFWLAGRKPVPQPVIDQVRQGRAESLLAVDDTVAAIVAALEHSHRLRDTLLVFTSDNGYLTGEHRLLGKSVPYEPATSVPLVIRWDGHVKAGRVDRRLTGNIDLAATIADAAGVPMRTEGSSLLGATRRNGTLLEAAADNLVRRRPYFVNRRPAYCGWRTRGWLFVRYATGEEELYSRRQDPDELHNLAGYPAYGGRLAALRAHARAACRPTPPAFHW